MDYRKTLYANKVATYIMNGEIIINFGTVFPGKVLAPTEEFISPFDAGFDNEDVTLADETIVYIDRRTAARLYRNLQRLADRGYFDGLAQEGSDCKQ